MPKYHNVAQLSQAVEAIEHDLEVLDVKKSVAEIEAKDKKKKGKNGGESDKPTE